MKVAILTDSNSGISQEEAEKLGIYVLPMPVLVDGEEYYEDINLTQEEFFEKIKEDIDISTSQPNIYTVGEKWDELLKTYEEIVYIPMSASLSSSCEVAANFSKDYHGQVQVVDNRRISVTQKQSVFDAIYLAKQGKSAAEIKKYLENEASQNSIYIMLDTLKYLKKGGRLTPAVAAIGTMLRIKPILQIQGGKLDRFSQVMTSIQGKKKMIEQIIKELDSRFAIPLQEGRIVISMAYTNCKDKALEFQKEVETALEKYNLKVTFVDPLPISIACHIGSGALALTISAKII